MDTEKVFTAFTKEGQEILIFRKDNDTYIDLNSDNKKIIEKDLIDLQTLVHAKKSINLKKHVLASTIKRKYKKDREKLLETKNILIGIERIIINLKQTKTDTGLRIYNIPQYNYHYKWDNKESGYLNLFQFKKEIIINDFIYNVYINLFDKKEYILFKESVKHISSLPSFGEGMRYIYSNGISLEELIQESIITKKKVYEYAYETRNTEIEK